MRFIYFLFVLLVPVCHAGWSPHAWFGNFYDWFSGWPGRPSAEEHRGVLDSLAALESNYTFTLSEHTEALRAATNESDVLKTRVAEIERTVIAASSNASKWWNTYNNTRAELEKYKDDVQSLEAQLEAENETTTTITQKHSDAVVAAQTALTEQKATSERLSDEVDRLTHPFTINGTTMTIHSSIAVASNNGVFSACSLSVVGASHSGADKRENVTSIWIGRDVVSIGQYAFSGLTSVLSVEFEQGSTLEQIDAYAFSGMTSLKGIVLPDTLRIIEHHAFSDTGLNNISFGLGIQEIGESAFTCSGEPDTTSEAQAMMPHVQMKADSFAVAGGSVYWRIASAINGSIFKIDHDALVMDCSDDGTNCVRSLPQLETVTSVWIGNAVTAIGDYVFARMKNLESVEFEPGSRLKTIGTSSFSACKGLTSVSIPDSVVLIGDFAFTNCDRIQNLTFGPNAKLREIGTASFNQLTALKAIHIPRSVEVLGQQAFSLCASVTSLTFGDNSSLRTIGDSSFDGLEKVTNLAIPASVETIGLSAFKDWKNVTTLMFGQTPRLTEIGDDAFNGLKNLEFLVIPSSVQEIGGSAFYGCTKISQITFGRDINLTKITSNSFSGLSALTSLVIPRSVQTIGGNAFNDCTQIQNLTFPPDGMLHTLETAAFYGLAALTRLDIPDSLVNIGLYAFGECTNLTTITLGPGSNLTNVAETAFDNSCTQTDTKIQLHESFDFGSCNASVSMRPQ